MEKTYEGFLFNKNKLKKEIIKPNLSKDLLESTFVDLVDVGFNVDIKPFYADKTGTFGRSGTDDSHNSFNVRIYKESSKNCSCNIEFNKTEIIETLLFVEPYIRNEFGYEITTITINGRYTSGYYSMPYKDFINKKNILISDVILYIKKTDGNQSVYPTKI